MSIRKSKFDYLQLIFEIGSGSLSARGNIISQHDAKLNFIVFILGTLARVWEYLCRTVATCEMIVGNAAAYWNFT